MLTILIILAAFVLIGAFVGVIQPSTIEHGIVCALAGILAAAAMSHLSGSESAPAISFDWLDYTFVGIGVIEGVFVAGMVNGVLERRGRRRAEAASRRNPP